ncbi:hypothetical protein [Cryptosporangium aurantiacum]|uniref:Uncharacterized protein n=1 Tax=Cryptosporangium aurantiacum TaxID=134849 RepID=A0A1M7RM57_9ACTN|nr:hypothetical protein [Cryptosporangium aurantiacum]SHN47271.1 hypothetical protein SAMN05443668_1229 [Cryptosporangium aurantiacum]
MSETTRFTERGVEEFLTGPEIVSAFTWENTPELLHVGLSDLYSGGMHGGKLATVSTVWLPANRAMGENIAEFETLVSGLAEHHDDLSRIDRWRTRAEAEAGHASVVEAVKNRLSAAHSYTEIHVVERDHNYRVEHPTDRA